MTQPPQATVPSATSLDPYGVPAKITGAYVQKVLDALEVVNGEATSHIVATHQLDDYATFRMRAVFADTEFQSQTGSWAQQISAGLGDYKPNPSPIHDVVSRLISGHSGCIFVGVERDFSGVAKQPPPAHISYVELTRAIPSNDPQHLNPTGWVISLAGVNSAGLVPDDPCAASTHS